jgi:hypothetical protein
VLRGSFLADGRPLALNEFIPVVVSESGCGGAGSAAGGGDAWDC